jgi:hypothetical protein
LNTKLAEEICMMQKIQMSADLSVQPISIDSPRQVRDSNHYEVFEVEWEAVAPNESQLKVWRLFNLIDRKQVHTATLKSQIEELLKPVKVKYGTQNMNKNQKEKFRLPLQMHFQSFEQGSNLVQKSGLNELKKSKSLIKSPSLKSIEQDPNLNLSFDLRNELHVACRLI